MSFYSIGKNEIQLLIEKKRLLEDKIKAKDKVSKVVDSFQVILLKRELEKIHTKLKILEYRSPTNGDID